jgi:nucleotide-binding universal stress UspA family protein
MLPKHIILTTDFSPEAQRSFAPVSSFAKSIGAKVTLLHSVQSLIAQRQGGQFETPIVPPDPHSEKKLAEQALREQAESLPSDLDLNLQLVSGTNVATAITDFAQQQEADVIALSTHGRSGLRRLVLGSVAEGVLRHAQTPVLCFPPRDLAQVHERRETKEVLLTTDLSKEALRAFAPVFEFARAMNWRITLLHVVPELVVVQSSGHLSPVECPQDLAREIAEARQTATEQCASFASVMSIDVEVISHLTPAKGIVEFANNHKVDLIAFSTHGRTGFRRLALGSVAEQVLRHSSTPILCFPRA